MLRRLFFGLPCMSLLGSEQSSLRQIVDIFNGYVNGPYTLSKNPVDGLLLMVFVNGLLQANLIDYGIVGNLASIAGLDGDPDNPPFIQIIYWTSDL